MLDLAKDCFVIMPFDEKTGPKGKKVNFDTIYQNLIRPAIEKAGLEPKRADEILCTSCFLLVRPNAPGCPVEDDACPIFG